MNRSIACFFPDDQGQWVAVLSCGHRQHVRHQPPFQLRPWVLDPEARDAKRGSMLACPLCDRAELPKDLRFVRSSPLWDERTMPNSLRRNHRLAEGFWGVLRVSSGSLHFVAQSDPKIDVVLDHDAYQAIPPTLEHAVEPRGAVTFAIDFLAVLAYDEPNSQ